MKRYLKAVLPTPAMWVGFLILPTFLTVYFLVSRYSDQFIKTQGIDYVAVQNNVLAQLYITGSLANFFTRFMDFAFWGVLATIAILIAWSIGLAKTTLYNHTTEQQFTNFNQSSKSWHTNFVTVLVIKLLLVVLMIYFVFQIILTAIPTLASGIAACVLELGLPALVSVTTGYLLLVVFQALLVTSVRLFKTTQAE